jgi:membrane-bound lytic murein transglycosylase A
LAPEASIKSHGASRLAFAPWVIAAALLSCSSPAEARRQHHPAPEPPTRHLHPHWPIEIPGTQYSPVGWSEIAGWADDDHLPAFRTFRASCKPIAAQRKPPADPKPLGSSLREPCHAARAAEISDSAKAREFFERHFQPLRISKLGDAEGFVTGYYEPIIDGSRTQTDVYNVPVYRRPSNLFVRGVKPGTVGLPNKGQVFRKIGRRKLVPYYDRAEIEDGAIAGRGLEIVWLKSQTDLLFTQIQGSARVRLEDGGTVRINYDAHNGYPYTPVGRILIERNIVLKEQMSMQRIRQWMDENPDGAKELRRQNRSYVFFRQVQLSDKDEAVGAQGVPLTPGRSIAVDKALHVYGTPFFIEGELPIESEQAKTPFRRLMIAQDTGSAIVGPARADLYFGAGAEAGQISGRMRHNARFALLLPSSLDPVARGKTMPMPDPRPSERIAKLFPQSVVAKDQPGKDAPKAPDAPATAAGENAKDNIKDAVPGAIKTPATPPTPSAPVAPPPSATVVIAKPVPLPEARPEIALSRRHWHRRHWHRRHRWGR